MAPSDKRTRRWSPKTRLGCRTCRNRRVKCDEGRPVCAKCLSSGRQCGGYEVLLQGKGKTNQPPLLPKKAAVPVSDLSASLPVLSSKLGPLEQPAFDFFRRHVSNSLSGHFSSSVFRYLALQVSHRQPVVLQAAIAVGSIYRTRMIAVQSSFATLRHCPMYQVALNQYNKAISSLSRYIESPNGGDPTERLIVVLLTCLLFVSFEMIQGDQAVVLSHLIKGLKILFEQSRLQQSECHAKRMFAIKSSPSDAIDQLSQVYVRLDADSTMFGRRAPYLCPRSFGRFLDSELKVPMAFQSVEEARSHLDTLTSVVFSFRGELLKLAERNISTSNSEPKDWAWHYCMLHAMIRRIDIDTNPQLAFKREMILDAFNAWSTALNALNQDSKRQAILMLRIQKFYPWFIIATLEDVGASSCDRFQDIFVDLIDSVSQYVQITCYQSHEFEFALEPGITASLYLLGIKCRDPFIRRKAIDFLRKSTVQEGMWNGKLFATFCQKFMDLEERGARELLKMDGYIPHIPEQARFADVVFGMDPSAPGIGRIIGARYAFEKNCSLEMVEDKFPLEN